MTRRQPSHPLNFTADLIRNAQGRTSAKPLDPEAVKRAAAAVDPDSAAAARLQAALDDMEPKPEQEHNRTILHIGKTLDQMREASAKAKQSKTRTVQQRLPAKPIQPANWPTKERVRRAGDGVEAQKLGPNDHQVRARVVAPFALPEENICRSVAVLAREPEPYYQPTRCDNIFKHGDGPLIHAALSMYIRDKISVERRTMHNDGVHVDSQGGGNPHPYTLEQGRAYRRISIVEKNMSRRDLSDLHTLANMFAPIDAESHCLSIKAFALRKAGITDDRVAGGYFAGVISKIGERVHDLMNAHRASMELALQLGS